MDTKKMALLHQILGAVGALASLPMMVVDKIERETEEPGDHLWALMVT